MKHDTEKERREFFNLMAAMADSQLDAPAHEIEEQILEEGDDTDDVRATFINAIRLAKQWRMAEARKAYETEVASYKTRSFQIPQTIKEKLDLLRSMLAGLTQDQQLAFTGRFRDFEKLADEDIEGILRQLIALQNDRQDIEDEP
jgi:hypothetical protein